MRGGQERLQVIHGSPSGMVVSVLSMRLLGSPGWSAADHFGSDRGAYFAMVSGDRAWLLYS